MNKSGIQLAYKLNECKRCNSLKKHMSKNSNVHYIITCVNIFIYCCSFRIIFKLHLKHNLTQYAKLDRDLETHLNEVRLYLNLIFCGLKSIYDFKATFIFEIKTYLRQANNQKCNFYPLINFFLFQIFSSVLLKTPRHRLMSKLDERI